MMDDMLKKYGLKYEDLNDEEKKTLNQWMSGLKQSQLTLDRVRDYVEAMRDSVLEEVSNYENGAKQDLFCKARIRNYTLLLGFLTSPEKAKQRMEQAIKNMRQ